MQRKRGPTIAVSGPPGSGKTTVARFLAEKLGLELHSAGAIFREVARRRGVSLEELNLLAARDPSIDLEIDRATLELGLRGGVVVEGHLVAWVLADVADFKLYLKAPLTVRVRRIASREARSFDEVYEETVVREYAHGRRFSRFYGFDTWDLSIFDLVIDTSTFTLEEVLDLALRGACAALVRRGWSDYTSRACSYT